MAFSFVKKDLPKASLRRLLHKHLAKFEEGRSLAVIHASDMTDFAGWCPRYVALCDVYKVKPKGRWLSTSEQLTYEIGRLIEQRVIEWFAELGLAVSNWTCLGCKKELKFQKRPEKCPDCYSKSFKPENVRFTSQETLGSCGVDMLVSLEGNPKLTHVEIKSINPEDFKALKAPLGEHRLRTNLYSRIIADDGHSWASMVDTSHGIVLYVSKGGYGCVDPTLEADGIKEKFTGLKEFVVARDDDATQTIWNRGHQMRAWREKHLMPEGICSMATIPRAQKCAQKGPCWAGEWEAGAEYEKLGS